MKKTNTKNSKKNSVSFATLLTLTFIVLKLCGVISWSWLWVLSPLWLGTFITIAVTIICILLAKSIKKDKE